jgi:hypothetical protein
MLRVMHVTFALFADAANLSQEGKLNILGVFDALQVATLPAMHPRATLVVHLKGSVADAGTHRVSLQWLSPSGIELWSSDGELGVASPPSGVLDMDRRLRDARGARRHDARRGASPGSLGADHATGADAGLPVIGTSR